MDSNRDIFISTYLNKIQEIFKLKSLSESFEIFSMAAILDRSFDEIKANDWTGGGNDGGIDGIYFEEGIGNITMHVFQCKYYTSSKKSLSDNDLYKFINDVKLIFKEGKEKTNSSGLKSKINYFREKVRFNYITIKQYFVFNGDIEDKQTINKNIYQQFHKPNEPECFEIWDVNHLYKQVARLIESLNKRKKLDFVFNPIKSNITSNNDNQGLITFSIYNTRAAMFRISALELCKLLDEEQKVNGTIDKIFSENIRGFLGKGNLTNAKIIETLKSSDKTYFPFFNNGLSIICEKVTIPKSTLLGNYIIPCTNPVIVNGLQTTYLIYQQYLEENSSIDDISVTIKICETSEPELIEKITDATNTQSVITFKDKISNKEFNRHSKELFNNMGIGYISKRGEVFTQLIANYSTTIQSDKLLKLWYAAFYQKPFEAATQEQIVYKNIFDATIKKSHELNPLFNGDIDSALYGQLWLTYKIYEFSIKEIKENSHIIHYLGYEFFCYMVFKILKVVSNEFSDLNINKIKECIVEVYDIIDQEKVKHRFDYFDVFAEILVPFEKRKKMGYNSDDYYLLFSETDSSNLNELRINTACIR